MVTFVSTLHVLLCIFMIFVILLQPGKDAGMGAALGGGAATSAFGGRGAVTFLSKITAVCATAFFLTSLGLSFVGLKTSVARGIAAPTGAAATVDAGTKAPNEAPTGATGTTGTEAPAPGAETTGATGTDNKAPSTEGTTTPPTTPAENDKKPGTPDPAK